MWLCSARSVASDSAVSITTRSPSWVDLRVALDTVVLVEVSVLPACVVTVVLVVLVVGMHELHFTGHRIRAYPPIAGISLSHTLSGNAWHSGGSRFPLQTGVVRCCDGIAVGCCDGEPVHGCVDVSVLDVCVDVVHIPQYLRQLCAKAGIMQATSLQFLLTSS